MQKLGGRYMKKEIHVRDAIGMPLAHDLTKIVPGEFKGRIFKKGHVIREQDIPTLLDIGKQHIYVLDIPTGYVHENEAAERLGNSLIGRHMWKTDAEEGKVVLKSKCQGLFLAKPEALSAINLLGEIAVVTKPTYTPVQENETLVGVKVIPLVIEQSKLDAVAAISENVSPVFELLPFRTFRVGVVTTGSEIASGRIEDRFGPILRQKLAQYGSFVQSHMIVGDSSDDIVSALEQLKAEGCDMLICTGGMSVDPDDRTPGAIRRFATEIVSYGVPMLPGSMMLVGYHDSIPIFGLPGCVIYDPKTSFDIVLPRILAGLRICKEDLAALGHGGYL
jgi:molybdenum cofactor synthesis domain-containing protein